MITFFAVKGYDNEDNSGDNGLPAKIDASAALSLDRGSYTVPILYTYLKFCYILFELAS